MKTLWGVLKEEVATSRKTPSLPSDYWSAERLETLKGAREKGLSNTQIRLQHFPELNHEQIKFALKKHGKSLGLTKRKLGNEPHIPQGTAKAYWTPENKEKLRKAYSPDKTSKEIVSDHFPELSYRHIDRAIRMFGRELGLPRRNVNSQESREFRKYWTPERKYVLRRAWQSGKPSEDIHLDHFSDISFHQLRWAVNNYGKEWGIIPKKRGPSFKDDYTAPLDKRDHPRVLADIKKGMSDEDIASKHFAKVSAIQILRRKNGMAQRRQIPSALIPDEHIEFAKNLRKQKATVSIDGFNGAKKRSFNAGQRIVAAELNKKFPGYNYTEHQVDKLIRSGTFALDTETKYKKVLTPKGQENITNARSIWRSHTSGKSEDEVVADHPHLPAKHVKRVLNRLKSQHERLTGEPKTERVNEGYKSLREMKSANDNQSAQDRFAHWDNQVKLHANKVEHHRHVDSLYGDLETDMRSENRKHLEHHEKKLAEAEFQRRKYQILSGGL